MRERRLWAGLLIGAGLLGAAACTTPEGGAPPTVPPAQAAPPAPPAACLLDPAQLAAVTGLGWTPEQATASDIRCVYDPSGPTPAAGSTATSAAPATDDGPAFLAVEITPSTSGDARAEVDRVAAVCAEGSRAPLQSGANGFVCRFRGGSVFAAVVRTGQLVTVSAAAVPPGTTTARLVLAVQQQLDALGG